MVDCPIVERAWGCRCGCTGVDSDWCQLYLNVLILCNGASWTRAGQRKRNKTTHACSQPLGLYKSPLNLSIAWVSASISASNLSSFSWLAARTSGLMVVS
jgi:hypothetical protein